MKARKFYPRQVAKKLAGCNPQAMNAGEKGPLSLNGYVDEKV